jgi:hypothetical protein
MKPEISFPMEASAHDWEVLRQSRPEDFQGYTGFERMTPAARLEWLEAAVQFVTETAGLARKESRNT